MITQEFINEFANLIEIPVNKLHAEFNLEYDGATWDSLTFISTMALVDKYYNIVLDSDALQNVKTFKELSDLILKRAV